MKLPAVPVTDMSNLTKEQLKAEIEKGFADAASGKITVQSAVRTKSKKNLDTVFINLFSPLVSLVLYN